MLVDQDNGYIFAILREAVERLFDVGVLGLGINYQEVLLRVGRRCDVLYCFW